VNVFFNEVRSKLRKATLNFIMCVGQSVITEQLSS